MGSLSSSSEIVLPLSSQKHDPAWKHCLMIKKGEKTYLKCMYCLKVFAGGGIHRIKEHLACQKGNASCCAKVLTGVRDAMRQSLEGVTARKRKKQRLAEEVGTVNPVSPLDALIPHLESAINSPLLSVPISSIEQGFSNSEKVEDVPIGKITKRARKKKESLSSVHFPGILEVAPPGQAVGVGTNRDQAYMAIGRFLYEAGVSLDSVNSVHFKSMIDAIMSAAPGLRAPSYHDVRGWILKSSLDEARGKLQQLKGTWARNGCSILADEWKTEANKTLINFLIYCSEGTVFLKSADVSEIVTSANALYELLKHVVEEVGVRYVVQVITNKSDTHALAGKMLSETFPTVFWTPCSVQIVDSILTDFSKLDQISSVLAQAQKITSFIYSHASVVNMMKMHTGGNDLVCPSISPAATSFSTLKALTALKDNLCLMMTSKDWMDCPYSKLPGSLSVVDLICSPNFWSSCSTIVKLTEPLVRALKIADSGTRPAMGYIYASMQCAKQRIKKELKKKKHYMPYWNIIDWRWDKELSRPLHLAGFFLNPQLFYKNGEIPNEVMSGMLDCIEILVPEAKIQDKINKELGLYKNSTGDFGRKMAIRSRDTLLPAEWWSTYGGGCPNLSRLAVRILSQTCSARGCDRHNIPFEQIHRKKNSLENQRFNDMIFIGYNLRLQQRSFLRNQPSDPISVDNCFRYVEDWLVEKNDFSHKRIPSSWMELNQPMVNGTLLNAEDELLFCNGFDGEAIPILCDQEEEGDMREEGGHHDNDERGRYDGLHLAKI